MIKLFTIIVLLAVGIQCKVIPDEVSAPISPEERTAENSDISPEQRTVDKSDISPEERSLDKSDDAASYVANSRSTHENSREGTVEEKEAKSKSDTSEATEERSAAESGSSERHERSTHETSKEGKKEETRSADVDDAKAAIRASNPGKSAESSRTGVIPCGKCAGTLRNSKGNSDSSQTRSGEHDNASPELKSGIIKSETAERDDASHINIKESRQAPKEGNIETPSLRSASDDNSKTGSGENKNSKIAPVESKGASEDLQLRTAIPEENVRTSMDAEQDAELLSDVGVESLVRSDIEALTDISPVKSLRIFHQKSPLRDGTPDLPETAAETRMAPQEDSPLSGLQVNSFGNSESGQSEYPYSPLDNSNPDISNMLPSLSNIISRNSFPTGNSFTSSQNSLPPIDANKTFKLLPSLSSPEKNGGFKPLPPLPPLQPMEPFKPLPPLRPLEWNRLLPPMEPMKPFEPLSPLRQLEVNGQNEPLRHLPPLEHFGIFKPLPPLRPLVRNRPFELLPPLPPLPPLEPIGSFKSLPPLRPLDRFGQIESLSPQDQISLFKILQHLQQLPVQAIQSRTPLFNPSPSIFSVLRQAAPEGLQQSSEGFSRTWHHAVSTPTTAMSFSRTVEYQ
ncbi:histone-lysine N-methyltransferase SETD1B-like [Cydia pomonella]|uniref:histone-lysine N-methyltransferase SETD1B-like n=1 Tax=Cydia pomonella TaxID=82600 RepID=UPI002ADE28CB|nr:histone-lysine N-methyltransferase SETD1B-like [Cydia pomonella]